MRLDYNHGVTVVVARRDSTCYSSTSECSSDSAYRNSRSGALATIVIVSVVVSRFGVVVACRVILVCWWRVIRVGASAAFADHSTHKDQEY